MLVFLNDTLAIDCGTHWFGGPDFAIEIVSLGDRTLEKLDFYAKVGTRELLVVDRHPWQLSLFRLGNRQLTQVARSGPQQSAVIVSEVIPLRLELDLNANCIRLSNPDSSPIRDTTLSFTCPATY